MADTNNPEVKKNDTTGKDTPTSTVKNTEVKTDTTTASSSAKPSAPITPTPVVKITTPQTKGEVKYPVEDLIQNAKVLTGYGKEVAVGALFNCKEKELTKSEFKKTIKDFLGKKVK